MTPTATLQRRPAIWPMRKTSAVLDVEPTTARIARTDVRTALTQWDLPDLIDETESVAGELVANAIRASTQPGTREPRYLHGQKPQLWFRICSDGASVCFEVWDQAPNYPKPTEAADDAETGRGLLMVAALTGGRWGWTDHNIHNWKCVWAQLGPAH